MEFCYQIGNILLVPMIVNKGSRVLSSNASVMGLIAVRTFLIVCLSGQLAFSLAPPLVESHDSGEDVDFPRSPLVQAGSNKSLTYPPPEFVLQ